MRMRRKRAATPDIDEAGTAGSAEGTGEEPAEASGAGDAGTADPRADGPWDAAERPVDADDETRAHLGALSIEGNEQMELRLQVDEASGQVQAVMLITADGAMELRAFAAARHEDLWDEIRPRMAEETTRRGGRAAEVTGPYGPALQLLVPGVGPDGQQVVQPSTVLGISGPRWLLRVMMFGRPATEWRPGEVLETALRSVVVNRGSEPMAPGDPLPLVLPSGARRVDTPR